MRGPVGVGVADAVGVSGDDEGAAVTPAAGVHAASMMTSESTARLPRDRAMVVNVPTLPGRVKGSARER